MAEQNDPDPPSLPKQDDVPPPPILAELEDGADAASDQVRQEPAKLPERLAFVLPERLAFLSNRFVIAGLSLVVVLLLVAIVLLVFGSGDGEPQVLLVAGAGTPTAEPTARPGTPLVGRILTTASTHNGPATSYAILGTIPNGAVVRIIGRSEDETWLQVIYPPGSQLRGWVNASFIEVTGDISQLVVAGPGLGPSVIVPTQLIPIARPVLSTVTPATAEATLTPGTAELTPPETPQTLTPPPGQRPVPTGQSGLTPPLLPKAPPTKPIATAPASDTPIAKLTPG